MAIRNEIPDDYNATLARIFPIKTLIGGYMALAIPGILCNLLIIYVSVRKGYVTGNFKDFVLNLAVMDLIYAVANFFYSFLFLDLFYYGIFCKLGGFFWLYGPLSTMSALIPVSVNRYSIICRQTPPAKFTPRLNLALCLFFDLMPAFLILPYGTVISRFGRKPGYKGVLCLFHVKEHQTHNSELFAVWTALLFLCDICSMISVVWLNVLIYFRIRRHRKTVETLAIQKRMRETAQVARATLIQATAPAATQLLLTVLIAIVSSRLHHVFNFEDVPLYGMILFTANPLIDALVTLYVVRPYRRAAMRTYKHFRGQTTNVYHETITLKHLDRARQRAGGNGTGNSGGGIVMLTVTPVSDRRNRKVSPGIPQLKKISSVKSPAVNHRVRF